VKCPQSGCDVIIDLKSLETDVEVEMAIKRKKRKKQVQPASQEITDEDAVEL